MLNSCTFNNNLVTLFSTEKCHSDRGGVGDLSVHGIGLVMRPMAQERLKVFVPAGLLDRASELTEALFSENAILEEEE